MEQELNYEIERGVKNKMKGNWGVKNEMEVNEEQSEREVHHEVEGGVKNEVEGSTARNRKECIS